MAGSGPAGDELRRAIESAGDAPGPAGSLAATFLRETLSSSAAATALAALEAAGLVDGAALAEVTPDELAAVAGVPAAAGRGWARRLIELARWFEGSGDLESRSTEGLRDELRSRRGLGPGAVDAILLDALDRPAYPVDRGTYRVLVRHGWIEPEAGYDDARATVEGIGESDPAALRAMRAGFAEIARRWCRPREARCASCPLRAWLPERGAILVEDA